MVFQWTLPECLILRIPQRLLRYGACRLAFAKHTSSRFCTLCLFLLGRLGTSLLRRRFTRSPHFCRHVLQLGETIRHSQYRLLVIYMHTRLERRFRNHCCIDIGDTPTRVFRHQVSATDPAPFANALFCPLKRGNIVGAVCDTDSIRWPKCESINRPRRPLPA